MYLNGFCLLSNWMFSMNEIYIIFTIHSKSLSTMREITKIKKFVCFLGKKNCLYCHPGQRIYRRKRVFAVWNGMGFLVVKKEEIRIVENNIEQ
jgi:hypothetical protein